MSRNQQFTLRSLSYGFAFNLKILMYFRINCIFWALIDGTFIVIIWFHYHCSLLRIFILFSCRYRSSFGILLQSRLIFQYYERLPCINSFQLKYLPKNKWIRLSNRCLALRRQGIDWVKIASKISQKYKSESEKLSRPFIFQSIPMLIFCLFRG